MHEKRKEVNMLLTKYFLNTRWLVYQLNCKGINVTYQSLINYLSGRRCRSKEAERVLVTSILILRKYGESYGDLVEQSKQ